jgi:lipid-binding SYLF domain-containing protein
MKKSLLVALVGLLAVSGARAADTRAALLDRVNSCGAILEDFMNHPSTAIPPQVWQRARGLIVVNQFKAGFIFGFKGGYGIIMVRKPDGRWSIPVLLTANEASFGFQAGAKSVETVYILTDDSTPRLLFKDRFNIGVDAKAVAGPKAAEVEKDVSVISSAPVLVYTRSTGLFAGATLKAGWVARNDDANFTLYDTTYTLPELLYSDWVPAPPDIQPLVSYVQSLSGP